MSLGRKPGKAGQKRRPASQETCRDRTSSGGVSRWCACDPADSLRACPAPVRLAFAPNISGLSRVSLPSSISYASVATLGTPRIGPRRELKAALESFWAGKSDEAALLKPRRPSRRQLGAPEARSASPSSRRTTSRSTTRCSTPASWSAPFPRSTAGRRRSFARDLFRDGARRQAATHDVPTRTVIMARRARAWR